jgi:hypothetical protein
MGGLAIPLVCMLAAAAEAGGRPPLGDEDKTMYRLLVQGSLGKGLVGEHPALASLGIRGLREGYQPSFTAVFPVQGEHLTDTRVLLVGLDWSGGENGLHGPWAGLRAGAEHNSMSITSFNWEPDIGLEVGDVERAWTGRLGAAAGWRWVYHPGFTVGARLGATVPVLRSDSFYRPRAGMELCVSMGWADARGRNPSPGYRARSETGRVKPEVIILPALAVTGVAAAVGAVAYALNNISLYSEW